MGIIMKSSGEITWKLKPSIHEGGIGTINFISPQIFGPSPVLKTVSM